MKAEVQIVNAFVDNEKGGNPAGVVLDADRFTKEEKQEIAATLGLSEISFVSKSSIADFKLEFFTPNMQIPHCGHATVATFSLLQQLGKLTADATSKETIDGTRAIQMEGGLAFMEQRAPVYVDVDWMAEKILASLRLTKNDLIKDAPVQVVNTGVSYMMIPLRNKAILKQVKPDFAAIEKISEDLDLMGYYAFSLETEQAGRDAGARMFAPRIAINEEAATGMCAGPLACYLFDILKIKKEQFFIEQGHYMAPASPSLIRVDLKLKNGRIAALMAGGKGIVMEKRIVELHRNLVLP